MTDGAAVAQGLAVGVGGAVLTLLGVDAQQLAVAFIACSLGAMLPKPVSRWTALPVFAAAVAATAVAASSLAPILAGLMPGVSLTAWSKLAALGVGIWLHPLIQVGPTLLPKLVDLLLEKLGKQKEGAQ